jgi:enediyne biosynthesis protein E4
MNNKFFFIAAIGGVALAVVLLFGLLFGVRTTTTITTSGVVTPTFTIPSYSPKPTAPRADESTTARQQLDATLWADEVEAQRYEAPLTALWDRLRASDNALEDLAKFAFDSLTIQSPGPQSDVLFGIKQSKSGTDSLQLDSTKFLEQLVALKQRGAELVQSEWHHSEFRPSKDGTPSSVFSVGLHIALPKAGKRIAISGKLQITWKKSPDTNAPPIAGDIVFSDYTILERQGASAFKEVPLPLTQTPSAMPILVYDLDGDGLSEIISPPRNAILKNHGGMRFTAQPFGELQPADANPFIFEKALPHMAGTVGDFTGDGKPDVVLAYRLLGAYLYEQKPDGTFGAPTQIFAGTTNFLRPQAITAGDVNGDGRPDLWIGQYKEPYRMGNIPDPIFDANDGFPAYLLINKGDGKFEDQTEAAGLAAKRTRRTYSGSFWDQDGDGDLDLLVVSDFSGIDMYENDGKGHFTDVTAKLAGERANFGMGHTFADFNGDEKLDFFVTGMSSTTARRLEALGLKRDEFPDVNELRMKMAFGNRMYLAGADQSFREPAYKGSIARSGWSWGATVLDFGNDGFPDVYVGNGHRSGKSCRDYCTRFWTHDIYSTATASSIRISEFENEQAEWIDDSWNGFEKNFLFLNQNGTNFINAGFPLDSAFEYDSRSVIAVDLDADGRQDLLVLEAQNRGGSGNDHDVLHLYRNEWQQNGSWIGIRLRPSPAGSEQGATVKVRTATSTQLRTLVTGDSFNCQHPSIIHFGLGKAEAVQEVEISWIGGTRTILKAPKINQYHTASRN